MNKFQCSTHPTKYASECNSHYPQKPSGATKGSQGSGNRRQKSILWHMPSPGRPTPSRNPVSRYQGYNINGDLWQERCTEIEDTCTERSDISQPTSISRRANLFQTSSGPLGVFPDWMFSDLVIVCSMYVCVFRLFRSYFLMNLKMLW